MSQRLHTLATCRNSLIELTNVKIIHIDRSTHWFWKYSH